jgi:threonine/homoserine/homoserine lactone efflux protein
MTIANHYSPTLLAALFIFAAVSSVTPGPNNILLMVSGVNFGIRRTVPQMAGIFTGLVLILAATGLGLGFVFSHFPVVRVGLMLAGIAYTLWLAIRVAAAGSLGGGTLAHPLRYPASLAFQWVNPKLWAMAVTAVALYVRPGHMLADTALVTAIFSLINIPAMLIWAGSGAGLRQTLQAPGHIRIFNIAMGLLLAASVLAFLRG